MIYHSLMPFQSPEILPEEVKVTMNVRVPLSYRNQLVERAAAQGISLNALLVHAIENAVPPA